MLLNEALLDAPIVLHNGTCRTGKTMPARSSASTPLAPIHYLQRDPARSGSRVTTIL